MPGLYGFDSFYAGLLMLALTFLCFSIAIAYKQRYFFPRKNKCLSYYIFPSYTLDEQTKMANQLDLFYGGSQINSFNETMVQIWNSGKTIIRGSDVSKSDPLQIYFTEDNTIIDFDIPYRHQVANNNFVAQLEAGKIRINFDYIDKNEVVAINIFYSGTKHNAIGITGTIKGINELEINWPPEPWPPKFQVFLFGSTILLCLYSIYMIITGKITI